MSEPRLDPKYLVDLKGKSYPLYAGVLDLAHQMGLHGIETDILQFPCAENGETTIVRAVATMKDGARFSGIGDASPKNTSPKILGAMVRLAETRAKGRALRDATNVGECLLEELPDLDANPAPTGIREMATVNIRPEARPDQHRATFVRQEFAHPPPKPAQSGLTAIGDVPVTVCHVCHKPLTAGQLAYCDANQITPPAHAGCMRRGA